MDKILTVIVPAYNMEGYLDKCLGSLVVSDKELIKSLEVIVVNDGSKDRTSEVAHEYEAKYPDVFRVIDKSNGHFGSCINVGLKSATGIFVKTLDADDYYDTNTFAKFLGKLRMFNPSNAPDLVINDYCGVNRCGEIDPIYKHGAIPCNKVVTLCETPILCSMFIGQAAITYRRSLLLEMGYAQTEGVPYTDGEWYIRPWGYVKTIFNTSDLLYYVLTERDGRTMEAQTYANGVAVIEELILKTLAWFIANESKFCEANAHILRVKILDVINHVYSIYILGCNGHYPSEGLKEFDHRLKQMSSSIYDSAMCAMPFLWCQLDILKMWRRSKSNVTLRLVKCHQHIRRKLSLLKHFFQKIKAK